MSTVSDLGSNSTTGTMLAAIMKRLDAMDKKLKGLDPIRNKVTLLEVATDELGNQQVTMTAAVECVDITHASTSRMRR
jgi:Cu/Ag efflux protein CusF